MSEAMAVARPVRGLEKVDKDRRAFIARQVRVSTGYTQGVEIGGQARLLCLSPAPRRASEPSSAAQGAVSGQGAMARMMAWLNGLPEGAVLPDACGIAAAIGLGGSEATRRHAVAKALSNLRDFGRIALITGVGGIWGGERAIYLVEAGRVLLSARAPANWAEMVRREYRG